MVLAGSGTKALRRRACLRKEGALRDLFIPRAEARGFLRYPAAQD
jgi:hypothetical protein